MRFRRPDRLLVLSLLSTLAVARSIPENAAADSDLVAKPVPKVSSGKAAALQEAVLKQPPKIIGATKDAPVDGLDGKPHAGPWIALDSVSSKKAKLAGSNGLVAEDKIDASVARLEKEGYAGKSSKDGWGLIPDKNDGVMDDKNRIAPKKGTTGTEGGVSAKVQEEMAKEKISGEKVEKKPDPPKEAPPLPQSEQKMIKDSSDSKPLKKPDVVSPNMGTTATIATTARGAQGLQKPTDLPDKPRDTLGKGATAKDDKSPHEIIKTSSGSDSAGEKSSHTESTDSEGLIQPGHSFMLAFVMIIFSEIGDKTFLVAALMAMRHDRFVVFTAAFSALIAMTVLSAVVGHAVPTLLPRRFVAFAAALLFLVFGARLLREGLNMPKDSGVGEEMEEVEAELEEKEKLARKAERRTVVTPYLLESGQVRRSASRGRAALAEKARSPSSSGSDRSRSPSRRSSLPDMLGGLNNLLSLILSPAWVQTFVMTFLGEWGDRSQIATVAMAAGQDYWWVTGGAIAGHMICTGIAVLGGRALAGRVSMRIVTIGGAVAFLAFGIIYLVEVLYYESPIATAKR